MSNACYIEEITIYTIGERRGDNFLLLYRVFFIEIFLGIYNIYILINWNIFMRKYKNRNER